MSDMEYYLNSGLYNAEDFQDKFVLEYLDENTKTVLKVYKTKRNLAKAIVRIGGQLELHGVRARTVKGVRIVQLIPDGVAHTPGYQEAHASRSYGYGRTAVWYHGKFAERVDTTPMDGCKDLTDEALTRIASDVGRRYGFAKVEASFIAFEVFKVRWTRTFEWMNLEVTDYLRKGGIEAIESVLTCIFEKIQGASSFDYSEPAKEYFKTIRHNQDLTSEYISRNHLELKDSGTVKLAMEKAGVTGYTETWYTPKGSKNKEYDPIVSPIMGIVALPKGHKVNIDELAANMAYGEKKLFGA